MHGIFDCGVCVWLIGKPSSQSSRETILLQLELIQLNGGETEMFFCSLYKNDIRFFKSIWK